GLTTMWNEMLDLSLPLPVLILNDDLRIFPWMRRWAEAFDWRSPQLTLLNSTWSHFVISKEVIDRLGAFDPGFEGIGFEDMDYTARAGLAGMPIGNVLCSYMAHKNHQPRSTSFGSDRVWGKYTSKNETYFYSKWETCSAEEGVFIKQIPAHVKPKHPLSQIPLPNIPSTATVDANRIFPDRPAMPTG
ncbi:MAG: glycosyltransferase family 2 protein, partial [Cyanobium sp.]